MARVAIFVMLPVVALLLWRDVVLERQIRALVEYDAVYRDVEGRALLATRDAVIDDATWELLDGAPDRAVARIKEAAAMPSPRGMPERAWLIAAAAVCARRDPHDPSYAKWRTDPHVARYCALVPR
jgi:hypothetical protein